MTIPIFHWLASLFYFQSCQEVTPKASILDWRGKGLSVRAISLKTGVSEGVVRRIVGKLDPIQVRRSRQGRATIAQEISGLPIAWKEKIARWRELTGRSEATFWRDLKRAVGPAAAPPSPSDGT